jgi:hypothetical protein
MPDDVAPQERLQPAIRVEHKAIGGQLERRGGKPTETFMKTTTNVVAHAKCSRK